MFIETTLPTTDDRHFAQLSASPPPHILVSFNCFAKDQNLSFIISNVNRSSLSLLSTLKMSFIDIVIRL